MKKMLAVVLSVVMLVCICGCSGNVEDVSSGPIVEYEHQQIIVDQDGNVVSSIVSDGASQNDVSSVQSTPTTSNNSSTTSSNDSVSIDYDTVVEVDICDDVVRGYLDAATPDRQFSWLKEYSGTRYDRQILELDWGFDASTIYTITFSESADFSNPYVVQSGYMSLKNLLLVPGKTYYWKVTGTWSDKLLGGGKIHVKDAPVRWIEMGGVGN